MKVSIVIPVYKSYVFLERCINSIFNDNNTDFIDVIIIDDTPPEFRENVYDYIPYDNNITILINNKNMGVTYSRNKGWFYSQSDYVVFLDSDDYLFSNAICIMLQEINSTKLDLYLFRTIDQASRLVGDPDYRKRYKGIDIITKTYNKGERLLCFKKTTGKPFISSFRGHEFSGILRYISKRVNFISLDVNVPLRVYCSDNGDSISSGIEYIKRKKYLVSGNIYTAKFFLNDFEFIKAIVWFLKVIKAKYL